MLTQIERPSERPPSLWQIFSDFGFLYASNGFVSWLFAVSAPVAIILTVGSDGGLSESEIASWIFGVFFINGLITILLSWLYKQPLIMLWTIPGAVLVGQSMTHLKFAEVIGAYYGTAALVLLLGATSWVKRAMLFVPTSIIMGMVAGVFLRFGLDLIHAVFTDTAIALPMVAIWLLLTRLSLLARFCPPIIGSLIVGTLATIILGRFDTTMPLQIELIKPAIQMPVWSASAMIELVVPLAITVIAIQNGQGFAVLQTANHRPPIDVVTIACGIGSAAAAAVGGVSTCLTGPANAIIVASGERRRQYTSAIFVGCLAVLFGLLAPTFTRLLLIAPKSLVTALAGLAMLRVLQGAFVTAFNGSFPLGALVALLVTVADVPLLNVGAAFWGLLCGFIIHWISEKAEPAGTTRS